VEDDGVVGHLNSFDHAKSINDGDHNVAVCNFARHLSQDTVAVVDPGFIHGVTHGPEADNVFLAETVKERLGNTDIVTKALLGKDAHIVATGGGDHRDLD